MERLSYSAKLYLNKKKKEMFMFMKGAFYENKPKEGGFYENKLKGAFYKPKFKPKEGDFYETYESFP